MIILLVVSLDASALPVALPGGGVIIGELMPETGASKEAILTEWLNTGTMFCCPGGWPFNGVNSFQIVGHRKTCS